MIIIPIALCVFAILILWQENRFTFASSILNRPLNYQSQKWIWMLIPRLLEGVAIIWLFSLVKWPFAVPLSLCALLAHAVFNKLFAKWAILNSIERIYPSFLEGIMENYKDKNLLTSELKEKEDFAKFLALREIWIMSTEPNKLVLSALLKSTGLSRLGHYLNLELSRDPD